LLSFKPKFLGASKKLSAQLFPELKSGIKVGDTKHLNGDICIPTQEHENETTEPHPNPPLEEMGGNRAFEWKLYAFPRRSMERDYRTPP
jgi:hypothetical protein